MEGTVSNVARHLLLRNKDMDEKIKDMPRRLIIKNAAKCNICGDTIESRSRHDFVKCKCGNLAVDGGKDYLRRVFAHGKESWVDTSEFTEEEYYWDGYRYRRAKGDED